VTESTTSPDTAPATAGQGGVKKRSGGLSTMLLADLKQLAGSLGVSGAGSMKKADLISAIKAAQSTGSASSERKSVPERQERSRDEARGEPKSEEPSRDEARDEPKHQAKDEAKSEAKSEPKSEPKNEQGQQRQKQGQGQKQNKNKSQNKNANNTQGQRGEQGQRDQGQRDQADRAQGTQQTDRPNDRQGDRQNDRQNDRQGEGDDQGDGSTSRSRRRRGRDRNRQPRNEPDVTVLEDDVLLPAAGILDVLDNYAFVRTSGYLAGPDDVYLSMSMVRKFGLRRGDALVGQVRQPREGERKEKFNPMVRIDTVNGADPESAKTRVDFDKLTPLYPSERLRLETEPTNMIGRVIDLAAPVGKGQRGLIVSPAKAGKTMVMQSIANSITTNNPECHLMVVLVDERPEEVTDFLRSVNGEVISSTFDRPASDHTMVAELAIERAKRLVELGHDVVVLLDGITRLGRAYNLSAPASGRILSGGVDSAALYPPKKFFGAARNIENGGSLTILATALIESGSKMDEVIFEEFKGTGNMEIRLRRDFADKRLFPAIDVIASGTRREELLLSEEEMSIVWKLRRLLGSLDGQQALELLLERLRKSQTNIEFLMQVQRTTPEADAG
jgi:transcription termination factor Rho